MQHTTQRVIRKIMHPSLLRKFNTNDRLISYNMLQHSVSSNTIQASTIPRGGNMYAQFYSTDFGWSRSHPMKRKGGFI